MVESASKGLILMWSKESLLGVLEKAHVSPGAWWMAVQREKRGRKGRGDREREEVLAAPFSLARPLPRCADTGKSENRKMTRKIISSHSSLKLKALSLFWRGPLFSNRLSDSRLRAPCLFDFLFLELFLSADDEEKKQKKLKTQIKPFPLPFQVSPAPSPEPAAARVRRSSWPR